jgi:hypothetical protein
MALIEKLKLALKNCDDPIIQKRLKGKIKALQNDKYTKK